MNYYEVASTTFSSITGFSFTAVLEMFKQTIIDIVGMQIAIITEWWPYIVGYVVVCGVFYIASLGMRKL